VTRRNVKAKMVRSGRSTSLVDSTLSESRGLVAQERKRERKEREIDGDLPRSENKDHLIEPNGTLRSGLVHQSFGIQGFPYGRKKRSSQSPAENSDI
jgi:hypothetical protein